MTIACLYQWGSYDSADHERSYNVRAPPKVQGHIPAQEKASNMLKDLEQCVGSWNRFV